MSRKKSFITNTFSNVAFNLLTQAVGFFIIPLFVKGLGQELFGIWILSKTIVGYFSLLDLGVSGGIVKFISESKAVNDDEGINSTINTSLIFYTFIGVLVFIVVFFFPVHIVSLFKVTSVNFNTAVNVLKISAVLALFSWPSMTFSSTMEGLMKYTHKNIFLGISSLLNSIIVLVLVNFNFTLEQILIFSSLANLIPWIGNIYVVKYVSKVWKFSFSSLSLKRTKEIFSFSLWVLVQQLIVLLIYQTDQIIIGVFLPVATITIYSVVTKLFYIVRGLNGTFFNVIWPTVFAASKINDISFIHKVTLKGSKYISLIIVPLSTLGFLVSHNFIQAWMGREYADYAIWAQLLFAVWFFSPMFGVFGNVLVATGNIKLINLFGVISTPINVGIGIFLTPRIGIGGVILGTVITYTLLMIIEFPIFMKRLKLDWRSVLYPNLRIIFTSVLIMIFGYFVFNLFEFTAMKHLFIFSGIYLTISYGVLLAIFLEKEEKTNLRNFIHSTFLYKAIFIS